MPSFEVVITVTSRFHWELKPFCYLFEMFWPGQSITVLSDRNPGLSTAKFINARNVSEEWSGEFSGMMLHFLQNDCQSDFIVFLMADYWLVKNVNINDVLSLVKYMDKSNVLRADLSSAIADHVKVKREIELIDSFENLQIYKCPDYRRDCFLTGALVPGMWNRQLLLETLKPGWNVWQTEIELSKKVTHQQLNSVLVKPKILTYTHNARTRVKQVDLRTFPDKLRKAIEAMIPKGYAVL